MSHQAPIVTRVSLGGGVDLAITASNQLVMIDYTGYRTDLGQNTMKRWADLQRHFERLIVLAAEAS